MATASSFQVVRRLALFAAALPLSRAISQAPQATQVAQAPAVNIPAGASAIFAVRVNVPIRIDGRLDEPVWSSVPASTHFLQRDPVAGAPATLATEVRMIMTNDAVIIGARLNDSDRTAMSLLAQPRNGESVGYMDDYFEIRIDPHRQHVSTFAFAVNPNGTRRSWIIGIDGTRDESWNIHWDASTRQDDDGWTVELKIPLSEFHVTPGTEHWGVQFVRFSWRHQETDVLGSSE